MKQILIILGLFASVSTFAQSPRIKLNQITKDSLTGSVLISSPSDSGMVYSRDFYISYGADTVLILYGDTLAATSGIISSVLSDGVTITGDGTSGNELKVDTSTVISTIQGLIDTLAARGYLQVTQLTDTLDANTRGFLTTEVDGSVSNEGSLTVGDGTASTSVISSNTSGSTDVTLTAGSNITLSEAGNNITIAATGGGTTYNNISETADTVFISGDLNVDANTLRVDATTNRVGIGTSTPEAKLSVVGNISLDSGNSNFVIGKNAGESLTSGSSNTAIGSNALQYTATANNNFAIGSKALQNNTIGYGNIAIGTNALRDNTEGANNFAIGTNALLFNETASSNLAIGNSALVYFNSGNLNTAIGNNAGQYLADGSQLTTASNSVYVGYFTKASANSVTNENVFGYSATGNGSNSVTLGNSSITKTILNGNVGIGTSTPQAKLNIVDGGKLLIGPSLTNFAIAKFHIKGEGSQLAAFEFYSSTPVHSGSFGFYRLNGTIASPQIVNDNDRIGGMFGSAYNGSTRVSPAAMYMYVDGVSGTDVGARFEFETGTNSTRSTRLTIEADGAILMPNVYSDLISGTTRDLYIKNDGQLGYISSTAKSKTNIYDLNNVDFIYNLNPVSFNYRKQNDKGEFTDEFYEKTSYGLIAEEVVDVADYMVYYDELEDGGFIPVGVNYSELITPMLKAIQQQKDEIDQLKTLITDLTNRLTILENK